MTVTPTTVPEVMRAVRVHQVGEPSVARVEQVSTPGQPTGTQLLVRVTASSINGSDLLLRRGAMAVTRLRPTPFGLGFDLAGEVVRCGPAVTAFEPGEPVMALLGHRGGALAEYVLVPQSRAARAPASVSLTHAAAVPLAGLTALQALRRCAGLHARASRRVLVIGAAGGIGSYAVQLAALLGAQVTAVASSERAGYLRDLGAQEVVDRHQCDVLASGQRWDVVLDAPGVTPFARVREVLAPDGVMVSTRPVSADSLRTLAATPLRRRGPRFVAVMTSGSSQDLALLARLVDGGRLRVPLARSYPLEQVGAAHAYAQGGGVPGKVVVTV